MSYTQNKSSRIKSAHCDTRIHVSAPIKMTSKGNKHTSFIGQQQRATLADNESRTAQITHGITCVSSRDRENLNHLGFPAKLKHTAPEAPLIKKTPSWWMNTDNEDSIQRPHEKLGGIPEEFTIIHWHCPVTFRRHPQPGCDRKDSFAGNAALA